MSAVLLSLRLSAMLCTIAPEVRTDWFSFRGFQDKKSRGEDSGDDEDSGDEDKEEDDNDGDDDDDNASACLSLSLPQPQPRN